MKKALIVAILLFGTGLLAAAPVLHRDQRNTAADHQLHPPGYLVANAATITPIADQTPGDQLFEQDTGQYFYWDGVKWTKLSNASFPTTTPVPTATPNGNTIPEMGSNLVPNLGLATYNANGQAITNVLGIAVGSSFNQNTMSFLSLSNSAPSTLSGVVELDAFVGGAPAWQFGTSASAQNKSFTAINMSSNPINNMTDPSAAQDGATKHYVDAKFTNGVTGTFRQAGGSAVTVNTGLVTGFAPTCTPTPTFTITPTATNTPTILPTAIIHAYSTNGVNNWPTSIVYAQNDCVDFANCADAIMDPNANADFVVQATALGDPGTGGSMIYFNQTGAPNIHCGLLISSDGTNGGVSITANGANPDLSVGKERIYGSLDMNSRPILNLPGTGSVTLTAGAATVTGLTFVTSFSIVNVSYGTLSGTQTTALHAIPGANSITILAGVGDTSVVYYSVPRN